MRALLIIAALPIFAATPQEREIRKLEKLQHRVLRDQADSEAQGVKTEASCRLIGRTLQISPLGVLACVIPPPPLAPAPPSPTKADPPKPEAEPAKP